MNTHQISPSYPAMLLKCFLVDVLCHASSKQGRVATLIGDMDVSKLMVYVQKVEGEKLRDKEEYKIKKS